MQYWHLVSFIIAAFFIGAGIMGTYRALKNKSDLFTKWHAFVYFSIPLAGIYYAYISSSPFNLPALLLFFIAFPLWLFSSIEVYNATEDKPQKTTARQYFKFLAELIGLVVAFLLFMYFIAGGTQS